MKFHEISPPSPRFHEIDMAFTPATAREDPKLSRPSLSELGSLEWQRGRLMWSVTLALHES